MNYTENDTNYFFSFYFISFLFLSVGTTDNADDSHASDRNDDKEQSDGDHGESVGFQWTPVE